MTDGPGPTDKKIHKRASISYDYLFSMKSYIKSCFFLLAIYCNMNGVSRYVYFFFHFVPQYTVVLAMYNGKITHPYV